jgi:hypothetical protein
MYAKGQKKTQCGGLQKEQTKSLGQRYECKPRKSPNCNEPTVTFTTVRLWPLPKSSVCEFGVAAIKDSNSV